MTKGVNFSRLATLNLKRKKNFVLKVWFPSLLDFKSSNTGGKDDREQRCGMNRSLAHQPESCSSTLRLSKAITPHDVLTQVKTWSRIIPRGNELLRHCFSLLFHLAEGWTDLFLSAKHHGSFETVLAVLICTVSVFFQKQSSSYLHMGADEPVLNHDSVESDSLNTKRKVCLCVK